MRLALVPSTLFAVFVSYLPQSALAQAASGQVDFRRKFVSSVYESCVSSSLDKKARVSKSQFCSCYSTIFESYTTDELKALSKMASSDVSRQVILVALNPQRRKCMGVRDGM